MPFRKVVFWVHLACGLTVGSVVLLMSLTGVLLTYEKQMEEWSDRRYWHAPELPARRAALSGLVGSARAHDPEAEVSGVTLYADAQAPAAVSLRGGRIVYLDPSSAEVRGEAGTRLRSFFGVVRAWHRWLNVSGDGRAGARAITGWSNLVFLFLLMSGVYLWVPKRWLWQHFRPVLLLNPAATGKARHFNWHHVFGIWMALPLALVVASATVISFPWASDLAYRVVGDEPPQRRATAPRAPVAAARALLGTPVTAAAEELETGPAPFDLRLLDDLAGPATTRIKEWRTVVFSVPAEAGAPVQVRIDQGWGGQPQKRHTLTYDAETGRELTYAGFEDESRGQRLRSYLRFAHTGEVYGLLGQSLAGIASLAAVFLVWTGFALAWRRLVVPLVRRGA